MVEHTSPHVPVRQGSTQFFLTNLPAWVVTTISYASVRGRDDESGAVQRFLNSKRIGSIKSFTERVGLFPASIILNWNNPEQALKVRKSEISIPLVQRSAQLIDGQHRVAGIRAAIETDPKMRDLELPVAIYDNLSTDKCADIFISINTEQKPVPKSLVYDLYGVASSELKNPAVERAKDLADYLNEHEDSPYYRQIKSPSARYQKGGIALSTAVSVLTKLVEEKSEFEQIGLTDFEHQSKAISNYLSILSEHYGVDWSSKQNPFIYSAGFTGAMLFFSRRIIPYCNIQKSFSTESISACVGLDAGNLIWQSEVKGKGGRIASEYIYERLNDAMPSAEEQSTFTF